MTRSSDSSGEHRAVRKEGHEHKQDREIVALRDELRAHVDDEMIKHDEVRDTVKTLEENNSDEHVHIRDLIHEFELRFVSAVERIEGKLNSHRLVAVVAWIIIVGLGGLLLDAHLSKLSDVADTVNAMANTVAHIDKRQESWEKFATGWGEALEKSDADIEREHERDVDAIRREMREFERRSKRSEED